MTRPQDHIEQSAPSVASGLGLGVTTWLQDPQTRQDLARWLLDVYPKQGAVLPVPKDKQDKTALWAGADWQAQALTLDHWQDHILGRVCIVPKAPPQVMAWDVDAPLEQDHILTGLRFLASHGLDAVATQSTSGSSWHVYAFFDAPLPDSAQDSARAIKTALDTVLGGCIDRVYPSGSKLTALCLGGRALLTPSNTWLQDPRHAPQNQAQNLDHIERSMLGRVTRWSLGRFYGNLTQDAPKTITKTTGKPKRKRKTTKTTSSKPTSPRPSRRPSKRVASITKTAQDKASRLARQNQDAPLGLQATIKALGKQKTLEQVLTLLALAYPKRPSYRHDLCLLVSPLLYRFGLGRQDALHALLTIAKQAQDNELQDRARCVHTSYDRLEQGLPVSQVPSKHAPKTAFCAVAWGQDLRSYAPKRRPQVAFLRVMTALDVASQKQSAPSVASGQDVGKKSAKNQPKMLELPVDHQNHAQDMHPLKTKQAKRPPSARVLSEQVGITRQTVAKVMKQASAQGFIDGQGNITPKGQSRVKRVKIVLGKDTHDVYSAPQDGIEQKRLANYRARHAQDRALYRQGLRAYWQAQDSQASIEQDAQAQAQALARWLQAQDAQTKATQAPLLDVGNQDAQTLTALDAIKTAQDAILGRTTRLQDHQDKPLTIEQNKPKALPVTTKTITPKADKPKAPKTALEQDRARCWLDSWLEHVASKHAPNHHPQDHWQDHHQDAQAPPLLACVATDKTITPRSSLDPPKMVKR
jgi:hypothetical protein